MVDFYIRMNARGSDPYGDTNYFNIKHLKKYTFENEFVQVYGYYDKSKRMPLLTDTDLIFAAGDIYPRYGTNAAAGYAGILNEIKVNPLNVSKYKGNYVICRIDLLNRDLVILNSQLGMKHIYYSNTGVGVFAGNNLNLFKADFQEFNTCAILQQMIFTYTISDETLLKGVYRMLPGEYAETDGERFSVGRYFDIQSLILENDTKVFDAEEFTHLFNRSVKERAHDGINVLFPGGFKGRTIVSSLINQAIKYKSFSSGMKGGDNTEVPLRISKELNINYEPIYFDTDYESNYIGRAKEAIYFSDGLSFQERTRNIYATGRIAEHDSSVLSGLAGEGVMEPVNSRTEYINDFYYYAVYLGRKIRLPEYLRNTGVLNFTNYDFRAEVSEVADLIEEKSRDLSEFRLFDRGYMYYLYDLMSTGFRMRQGSEIHTERAYSENLTPFYDIDLIEYLLSTDYTEIYRNAFRENKLYAWKWKKIYSVVIDLNYPDLNRYPVDSGYPPEYLLNPVKSLLIPFKNRNRNKNGQDFADFESKARSSLYASDFLKTSAAGQEIFDDKRLEKEWRLHSTGNAGNSGILNRAASLAVWMSGNL